MILLIDNYDSFTYNIYQSLAVLGEKIEVFRNDKISISQIEKLKPKGIILSPGPGRPNEAGICIEIVKKLSGKIPILGICLGHQAIAEAFGGQVEKATSVVHGKSANISHKGNNIFKGLSSPFQAGRYHSLCVKEQTLPNCLGVNAKNDDGLVMGLSHTNHKTYGVQFHPESILTPDGDKLLANFKNICIN